MASERYPGERHGLGIFLEALEPAVAEAAGSGDLLRHAIRRALRSGDLDQLRHARALFDNLPPERRQRLSGAMAAHGGASSSSSAPPRHELLERYGRRPPAAFVSFELASASGEEDDTRVGLTHELLPHSAVRVLVSPGTLPQTAAAGLRRIAQAIESDRRLLSERHWERRRAAAEGGEAR